MKTWILNVGLAIVVMLITASVAHLLSVKDWETCFSAGAGAGIAALISIRYKNKKLSRQA